MFSFLASHLTDASYFFLSNILHRYAADVVARETWDVSFGRGSKKKPTLTGSALKNGRKMSPPKRDLKRKERG